MKSKIILVYKDLEGNIAEEIVWAKALGNGLYQIDNIPFYAPNVSYNDIVTVENDEGLLYFDGLERSSGHSTIQVVFFDESKVKNVLEELVLLGCKWEGMEGKPYYAIDVSPDIHYADVRNILNQAFEAKFLDYKESCIT